MSYYAMDTQLEEVSRAVGLMLRSKLPDALTAIAMVMDAEDAVFYAAISEAVPETPLEAPTLYMEGHHPSLLERPPTDFPNVVTMAYNHRSAGDTGADQYEPFTYPVYVEIGVLHTDESTINRIAWRYAKALHRAVIQNDTLSDFLTEVGTDPSVVIARADQTPEIAVSNASARRVSEFADDVVFVQLVRLDTTYRVIEPY